MDTFINFIENVKPLSDDTLKALMEVTSLKRFQKKEFLTKQGEHNKYFYFILQGGVRKFTKRSQNKKEINTQIIFVGEIASSLKSLTYPEPASMYCQAITDCVVIRIPLDKILKLREKHDDFKDFLYKTSELELARLHQAYFELLTKDSTVRYIELKNKIKNIDQLLPQYQIASYLGITPIQLSRISKKLLEQH